MAEPAYLDDNGNPITKPKVYLDDNGNPINSLSQGNTNPAKQLMEGVEAKKQEMLNPGNSRMGDPSFQSLPLGEQLTEMRRDNPNFAALSPKDQGGMIAKTRLETLDKQARGKGFGETVMEGISNLPGTVVDFVKGVDPKTGKAGGPLQYFMNIAEAHGPAATEQERIAAQEEAQGEVISPFFRRASRYVPGGPQGAVIGEKIRAGKVAEGLGDATMLVGPSLLGAAAKIPVVSRQLAKIPDSISYTRTVRNVNNPIEESALASVAPNVRMTPGQRAGDTRLQKVESNLRNYPETGAAAEDFYRGQELDVAAEMQRRVQQQGQIPGSKPPLKISNISAGNAVLDTLDARKLQLKAYADKLYDSFRQTTARAEKYVETGTGSNYPPSSDMWSTAHSSPAPYTLIEKVATPVALDSVRQQLVPVYEELTRNLQAANRPSSPAFGALDEFMKSNIKYMPAADFDRFLSAVKKITRNGKSEFLRDKSQALATQIIADGEKSFQNAVQGAGPNVLEKLKKARQAVRGYHDVAEVLDDLKTEPAALFGDLVVGKNKAYNRLLTLKQWAPKALESVGRTYLEQLMETATNEGGWGRSAGVKASWERMGPETKNLLFGPKVTQSLNDGFLAAKRLVTNEGSQTAGRGAAFASYGEIGNSIAELLGGVVLKNPFGAAVDVAGKLVKTRGQRAVLAKLAFHPAGAQLLNQVLQIPSGTKLFKSTMDKLNQMAKAQAAVGRVTNTDKRSEEGDPLELYK